MFEDIHHNLLHYLVLILILLGGLTLFLSFSHQPQLQWRVAELLAILYVFWGIGHHWVIDKHIYAKVVIEYVLISLLGLFLLRWLLFQFI